MDGVNQSRVQKADGSSHNLVSIHLSNWTSFIPSTPKRSFTFKAPMRMHNGCSKPKRAYLVHVVL